MREQHVTAMCCYCITDRQLKAALGRARWKHRYQMWSQEGVNLAHEHLSIYVYTRTTFKTWFCEHVFSRHSFLWEQSTALSSGQAEEGEEDFWRDDELHSRYSLTLNGPDMQMWQQAATFTCFLENSRAIYLSLDFLVKCIGEEAKYEGVRLLFDGLQQPVLNKQVHTDTHRCGQTMIKNNVQWFLLRCENWS